MKSILRIEKENVGDRNNKQDWGGSADWEKKRSTFAHKHSEPLKVHGQCKFQRQRRQIIARKKGMICAGLIILKFYLKTWARKKNHLQIRNCKVHQPLRRTVGRKYCVRTWMLWKRPKREKLPNQIRLKLNFCETDPAAVPQRLSSLF